MSYFTEYPDPPSFVLKARTPQERELIVRCWHDWRSLDLGTRRARSERDRRLQDILHNPIAVVASSTEERLLKEVIRSLGRADFNSVAAETPHYQLAEPAENWYSRDRCRIGIHIPNPRDRVYFNRQRHR